MAGWGVTLEPQGGERVKFCPQYLFSPHIVPIDLRTKYQTHKESKGDCLIGVLVKGQRAHVSVLARPQQMATDWGAGDDRCSHSSGGLQSKI